ncbi:hypothetical protein CDL12_12867 [Handroanthus impetiginosus]|uniref:C2H2-type domain-containing protein n=1 Tax=Handroanthus impetiginosus TaxID=429701 RepID=A0A2G9HAF7_9LAMI|nr:hypothetical protein CDL12_12867 [Handroanthus impetiginosus]
MVTFLSFFILLFHLGCFIFSSHHRHGRRRRDSPKTTIVSFFKRLFSSTPLPPPPIQSPSSSTRSLRQAPRVILPPPDTDDDDSKTRPEIHPCSICGEILQSPSLLDLHQSSKHAISHPADGENIIRIIFKMGWPQNAKNPIIHRILKIHNSPKIITRFEEYREFVKSRAASKIIKSTLRDQRCIADGNELLRFYCTTFICELDYSICNQQYCSLCGIIKNGFSPKMDGISTLPTSYRAHMMIPEDIEEEFKFMNVKRGLLVCRVIAGRVGCDLGLVDKEDPGFDSLAGQGNGDEEDELVVFNPRAVLPCFVIVYAV